jgi:hypothetical protein
MYRFRHILLAASLMAPIVAAPARAHAQGSTGPQAVTPEAAQGLEQQLRMWLAGLLGPRVDLGQRPVHVAPEGDHFRLEIPIAGPIGTTGLAIEGDAITTKATPSEGGRWIIEELRCPSPLRMTGTGKGFAKDMPRAWTVTMQEQATHGVLDPAFASASRFESTIRGYRSVIERPAGTGKTTIARLAATLEWTPNGAGRIDLAEDVTGEGLAVSAPNAAGDEVTLVADKMRSDMRVAGVAPDQVAPIVHAALELAPLFAEMVDAPAKSAWHLPEVAHGSARTLVTSLRTLLGAYEQSADFENIRFQAAGHSGSLRGFSFRITASAPGGMLQASLPIVIEGPDSKEIPKGPYHDLIPHKLTLTPRLAGVPASGFADLVLHAIDADDAKKNELASEAVALLAQGPLRLGLDNVAFDIGPAAVTANGEMKILSPDTSSGSAEIRMTSFDALLRKVSATPELKQAVLALIFLKGIGDQQGAETVWRIEYADGKLMVNDQDLSAMMPGAK